MAKRLSLWWTDNEDDSVLWRSHGSGNRATVRTKQGKKTKGQYGDLAFTDPMAKPLIDVATIELKKNLNKVTIIELLDKPKEGMAPWEKWYDKIEESHVEAGSLTWWIIHQRKGRLATICFPKYFLIALEDIGVTLWQTRPFLQLRIMMERNKQLETAAICAMRLEDFLKRVKPANIIRLWKEKN